MLDNHPETEKRPDCYGDPEAVCPEDENGFIEPQRDCISCPRVTDCLKIALSKRGFQIPEPEKPNRVVGFFKRWSDRKLTDGKAS
jgi:hypothetical protein